MKYFLKKIKDVGLSVLPIMLVVLVVNFGFAHFDTSLIVRFIVSILIIIIGEVFFLSGVDGSVMQMGEYVGNSVNKFSRLAVVLFFAFIFGLCATVAEPDVNVLSNQVIAAGINIPKFVFIFTIGAGVGAFVAFALFRIIKNINYKIVIFVIYLVVFILTFFVPDNFVKIAFDAGGATTGIITSPFLLALSCGIARNRNTISHSDNFGAIGIASAGPVLAVLFLSLISGGGVDQGTVSSFDFNIFLEVLIDASISIIPLVAVFFIFDAIFLKIPKKKKISLIVGSLITFLGLYLFLFGIDFGLAEMGRALGSFIATQSPAFVIGISVVLGFLITFTEPSVRILGAQVEDVTHGNIRRIAVVIAIAISMIFAVTLSALKIMFHIPFMIIITVLYGLIALMLPFSSTTFTAIAFDSGGVASGPMSAAFILPLMIGFASSSGSSLEGFGLIAIVGAFPILVLEAIGVAYNIKMKTLKSKEYKKALRISYGLDMYSNIDALEEAYNRRIMLKELSKQKQAEIEEQIMVAQAYEELQKEKESHSGDIKG